MMKAVCCLLLVCMLFSLRSGVEAANAALGETCTSQTTCTGADNICDTNRATNSCQIKREGTCTKDDDCVAGATCVTGPPRKCTCTTGISTDSGDLCNPVATKAGGACTKSDDKCGNNSQCGSNSKCACKGGYTINYKDYTCQSGASTIMASLLLLPVAIVTSYLL